MSLEVEMRSSHRHRHEGCIPVNEAEVMDSLDGEDTLSHVEAGDILREGVVLDEHGHEITAWQELHDEVEVGAVLEGVEQLNDPWRVRLCEDITLSANVGELEKHQSLL